MVEAVLGDLTRETKHRGCVTIIDSQLTLQNQKSNARWNVNTAAETGVIAFSGG